MRFEKWGIRVIVEKIPEPYTLKTKIVPYNGLFYSILLHPSIRHGDSAIVDVYDTEFPVEVLYDFDQTGEELFSYHTDLKGDTPAERLLDAHKQAKEYIDSIKAYEQALESPMIELGAKLDV